MTLRVLLVEDHAIVRDALATMLGFEDDITVVGATGSGADAVRLAVQLDPDIALVDVGLEGLNGIEATHRMRMEAPRTRVIILSMHDDEDTVLRAVATGAAGFLPKNASRESLFRAIRAVGTGEAYLDGRVTAPFLRRVAPVAEQALLDERLTPREQGVLELLVQGLSSKEIASSLVLGEQTIKTHLSRIYQKLGVNDRVQAVVVAIRRGLVS